MEPYDITFYSAVECSVTILADSEEDARRMFMENSYDGCAEIVNGGLFIDLSESIVEDMPVFIIPRNAQDDLLV